MIRISHRGEASVNFGKTAFCKTAPLIAAIFLLTASAFAQTFTLLHSFNGTDGSYPSSGLVQGLNGSLYGMAPSGGTDLQGTVYKMTPSGTLAVIHEFTGTSDGSNPYAALILAINGNFYGVTYVGGASGNGTVFSMTPAGTVTTLHSFDGTDGAYPDGSLAQSTNGKFYGTTQGGGANNFGTVFDVTSSGSLTSLYSFCISVGCSDGQNPYAGLIQDTNGNFYGTTLYGGGSEGNLFQVTPAGAETTIDYFGFGDGAFPTDPVFLGTDGYLYGTTGGAGTNNYGTVFRTTTSGTIATIYNFSSTDGAYPYAGLYEGTDGKYYGTTYQGGANGYGTIFNITPAGVLTTLHSFDSTDGANPEGGIVQDTNGVFYGTTRYGGARNDGTVFSLNLGLRPFVMTLPGSAKVGTVIKILGTNLTGATSVTFNGTTAAFTVVSGSEITATVPTGATSGFISVATSKGTFKSNRKFLVIP
jgi:uncharacterized repeat protein (TIGR03803 family)